MTSLAARRVPRQGGGPGGGTATGAFAALESAAEHVRAVAGEGSAPLLARALQGLTEATAAAEELASRQIAVGLITGGGSPASGDGGHLSAA